MAFTLISFFGNYAPPFFRRAARAAHRDPVPALAFHRVANLLEPPPSVMHPRIAVRVLLGNLRPRGNSPAAGESATAVASGR
jgi:hypothetical protein